MVLYSMFSQPYVQYPVGARAKVQSRLFPCLSIILVKLSISGVMGHSQWEWIKKKLININIIQIICILSEQFCYFVKNKMLLGGRFCSHCPPDPQLNVIILYCFFDIMMLKKKNIIYHL